MKPTYKFLLSLALAAGITNSALAVDLHNGIGAACNGIGTWHFVNNQTGGAAAGLLNAQFSNSNFTNVSPTKVLSHVQHFVVETYGNNTLVNASTNLPGMLVLSDYKCVPDFCGEGEEC